MFSRLGSDGGARDKPRVRNRSDAGTDASTPRQTRQLMEWRRLAQRDTRAWNAWKRQSWCLLRGGRLVLAASRDSVRAPSYHRTDPSEMRGGHASGEIDVWALSGSRPSLATRILTLGWRAGRGRARLCGLRRTTSPRHEPLDSAPANPPPPNAGHGGVPRPHSSPSRTATDQAAPARPSLATPAPSSSPAQAEEPDSPLLLDPARPSTDDTTALPSRPLTGPFATRPAALISFLFPPRFACLPVPRICPPPPSRTTTRSEVHLTTGTHLSHNMWRAGSQVHFYARSPANPGAEAGPTMESKTTGHETLRSVAGTSGAVPEVAVLHALDDH